MVVITVRFWVEPQPFSKNPFGTLISKRDRGLDYSTVSLLSSSWGTRWTVSLRRCVRPCSGRWSPKPWRLWIFQVCSAPAATATSAPSRPAAPRTTTASPSSPCRAPREASKAGPVSVCGVCVGVWRTCGCLLCGGSLVGDTVGQPVGEGILWQLASVYLNKTSLQTHTHTHP